MSDQIVVCILGEPVAKGRPRMTRDGITYTPEKTANWEALAKFEASRQYKGPPLAGCLIVTINAYFSIPKSWPQWKREQGDLENIWHTCKPDADNVVKCIDAFNGQLWADDAQIATLSVNKRYSGRPRVEVTVRPVSVLNSKSKRNELESA